MKPKVRKIYKQVLALIAIPFILTGCKKADCSIPERHVHKYVGSNKRGTITNYFDSEDEKYDQMFIHHPLTEARRLAKFVAGMN